MPTIAVDFDGVIHKYSQGWKDGTIYDEPMTGVREALQHFLDLGFSVIIFSTRAYGHQKNGEVQPPQYNEIVRYLTLHQIPYTSVYRGEGKPLCQLFIDDNAIRFTNWEDTLRESLNHLRKYLNAK